MFHHHVVGDISLPHFLENPLKIQPLPIIRSTRTLSSLERVRADSVALPALHSLFSLLPPRRYHFSLSHSRRSLDSSFVASDSVEISVCHSRNLWAISWKRKMRSGSCELKRLWIEASGAFNALKLPFARIIEGWRMREGRYARVKATLQTQLYRRIGGKCCDTVCLLVRFHSPRHSARQRICTLHFIEHDLLTIRTSVIHQPSKASVSLFASVSRYRWYRSIIHPIRRPCCCLPLC